MNEETFQGITAGLEDAIAFVQGDASRGRVGWLPGPSRSRSARLMRRQTLGNPGVMTVGWLKSALIAAAYRVTWRDLRSGQGTVLDHLRSPCKIRYPDFIMTRRARIGQADIDRAVRTAGFERARIVMDLAKQRIEIILGESTAEKADAEEWSVDDL
ncbi:MAG: hypothetical protein KGJ57_05045 [Sphingomonadales bacterium]|nr:hypothetical protein [Sphingomonadales bacterium]MDE2168783.1 hypothetical protein [Sphingomonadales bacterium]